MFRHALGHWWQCTTLVTRSGDAVWQGEAGGAGKGRDAGSAGDLRRLDGEKGGRGEVLLALSIRTREESQEKKEEGMLERSRFLRACALQAQSTRTLCSCSLQHECAHPSLTAHAHTHTHKQGHATPALCKAMCASLSVLSSCMTVGIHAQLRLRRTPLLTDTHTCTKHSSEHAHTRMHVRRTVHVCTRTHTHPLHCSLLISCPNSKSTQLQHCDTHTRLALAGGSCAV